jgi:serine/threonine protein kinase/tetratricopeptide (TPR) repeat protein
MGRVWRGDHVASGTPVAIKVVNGQRHRGPAYMRIFRNEVEAVARLSHTGIVRVFDFGEVPVITAIASAGELDERAPYLVMEIASEGSLDRIGGPGDWRELKTLLAALLDALAHAHARGVVHRDLKPANVLVDARGSRRVFKLTDFGIARAAREDDGGREAVAAICGTPLYMAPEQFSADERAQGPWTDLYALGCTAYALVSGAPPFPQKHLPALILSHAKDPPPPLFARFEVPHGFEDWLQLLLAKRPADRFQCAADARHALEQLPELHSSRPGLPAVPLRLLAHTTPLDLTDLVDVPSQSDWLPPTSLMLAERAPPPLPTDWRTSVDRVHEPPLTGVGAGIFGLRSIPMVDRDVERDALWRALCDVHLDGRPRAMLLHGSAGSGKSRVARFIAERAAELGGVTVMRATHSMRAGTRDGVLTMFARHLRCDGLTREEVRARLAHELARLGDDDAFMIDSLTDLLVARDDDATWLLENPQTTAEGKSRVLVRYLHLLARTRVVVLVLDDVHWGLDALRMMRLLLEEHPPDTPVLGLLTFRDEALAQHALERQELDELRRHEAVSEITVTELEPVHQRLLVEQLLGLSGDVVHEVATRTGGNPLFAVQLVGDWIARGLLVATDHGLAPAAGSGAELPDDIHTLCTARIEHALLDKDDGDRRALELAALLGGEVQTQEWARACSLAGVSPAGELPHELARLGLLEHGASGWRFTHGVLRESLERLARDHGRWIANHRIVARVLMERYPSAATSDLASRIGRHLAEGGELDEAHRWLLNAARMLRVESDRQRAEALLAERDIVLDRLAVPAHDERRAKGALLAALLDLDAERWARAEERARTVLADAEAHEWPLIEAHARLRLGGVMLRREEFNEALPHLHQAMATLAEAGDRQGEFEARAGIAEVCYYLDSLDASKVAYMENLRLAEALGDALATAESHWGLGYVALWQGQLREAQEHFETMRELLMQCNAWFRLCHCINALGEVARVAGRYAEAEQYYVDALRLLQAESNPIFDITLRMNLAMVRLFRGEKAPLERMLPQLLADARAHGRPSHVSSVRAIQAAVDARAQRWEGFDQAMDDIERLQNERGVRDGDNALMLRRAGDFCREHDEATRARRAYSIARTQWEMLGRKDEAAAMALLEEGT